MVRRCDLPVLPRELQQLEELLPPGGHGPLAHPQQPTEVGERLRDRELHEQAGNTGGEGREEVAGTWWSGA